MKQVILSVALLALAACSNPEKTGRYLIDPPDQGMRVTNRLGSAELRDVSLPEYASGQEVPWQTEDGAVRSNPKQLWADSPQRGFTLTLARAISDVSGATVIAEPWPLSAPPKRRLDVRVERALAGADGVYRLSGRYFVSNDGYGAAGSDFARSFNIAIPLGTAGGDAGPEVIARAQSEAIARLAVQIAQLQGPGATLPAGTGQSARSQSQGPISLDQLL